MLLTVSYTPFLKVPGSTFHRVWPFNEEMSIRTEDEVLEAVEMTSIDGEPVGFILKLATFHIIHQG